MKAAILFLVLFFFFSPWLIAQTPEINEIGYGAEPSQEYPFSINHGYTRSATLYPNASGYITNLGWYVGTGKPVICPVKIYLKTTTVTALPSSSWTSMINGATLVFNGMLSFPVSGWTTIDVADYMNTGYKIVVLCEVNYGGNGASKYSDFGHTEQYGFVKYHEFWQGQVMSEVNGSTGTISINPNNRPNIQITYYPSDILGLVPPTGFMPQSVSSSQVNLKWSRKGFNDNVMVAFNTENTFGTPTGTYIAGESIIDGGTVLYNGPDSTFNHTGGLSPNTTYYYKAWSVHSPGNYSIGTDATATTLCPVVTTFPSVIDFESLVVPPDCWSLAGLPASISTSVSGCGFGTGSVLFNFFEILIPPGNFDLVSPQLNLTTLNSPAVKFDHAYATSSFGNVDQLELWSSSDNGVTYTWRFTWLGGESGPLNTGGSSNDPFVPTANEWRTKSCSLPAGTNRIIFRGMSVNGNNLYLDNITFQEFAVLWNGTISSSWSDPGNWTPSGVPTNSQNIDIPSCTPHPPIVNSTGLECKNLTINPGASLIINSGGKLTIRGNLTIRSTATLNNQGLIILKGNLDNQNQN